MPAGRYIFLLLVTAAAEVGQCGPCPAYYKVSCLFTIFEEMAPFLLLMIAVMACSRVAHVKYIYVQNLVS